MAFATHRYYSTCYTTVLLLPLRTYICEADSKARGHKSLAVRNDDDILLPLTFEVYVCMPACLCVKSHLSPINWVPHFTYIQNRPDIIASRRSATLLYVEMQIIANSKSLDH